MKIYAVLDADGIEGGIGWYFSEAAARYSLDALAKRYPWMVKEDGLHVAERDVMTLSRQSIWVKGEQIGFQFNQRDMICTVRNLREGADDTLYGEACILDQRCTVSCRKLTEWVNHCYWIIENVERSA